MQRINGRKARDYTTDRKDFRNSNGQLYGLTLPSGDYVVYSYGQHWPLYLFREGQWYGNEDRYSSTTSHHRTYAMPRFTAKPIQWMGKDELQRLIRER